MRTIVLLMMGVLEQSDLLANPADDHTESAFAESCAARPIDLYSN